MVFVSILPHADFGPYDDWEDASHFIFIPCHEILAKAFLCYNNSIFDNQSCIFFHQGIFSIITSHNISNINFLIITYWWHCRFLQFSCSSYLIFLCEFTFYYGYIWRKILREVIPLRMDDADDSIKNPWNQSKNNITFNVKNMHSFESHIRMQVRINNRRARGDHGECNFKAVAHWAVHWPSFNIWLNKFI